MTDSKGVDYFVWNVLDTKACLLFGRECASVALWVMICLTFKSFLYSLCIGPFFPRGFIYSLPLLIQYLSKYVPVLSSNFPILPVRIAECFLGKVTPVRMLLLIPAHMLGAIFGALALKSLIPFLPYAVFLPVDFSESFWAMGLLSETVLSFIYCLVILVLPYILDVNMFSSYCVSMPLLPMMLVGSPVSTSCFNPAVVYALWYLNYCSALTNYSDTLPWERILGPIIGAVAAGIVCNIYFPDDPRSWTRAKASAVWCNSSIE